MLLRFHRRDRFVRAFCSVLLLLCLVVAPALVAASETHESAHVVLSGHAHDGAAHDGGMLDDEPSTPVGQGDWHLLLHSGHCCGHGTIFLPVPIALATLQPAPPPAASVAARWPSTVQRRPLRPPIDG